MMRAVVAFLLLVSAAHAAPVAEEAAICHLGEFQNDNTVDMPGCPADVKDLIDRAINCQHWTGEEPYDTARAHEIDTAIAELKCDDVSNDYDRLQKKYAKRLDVMQTMELADREFSIEF